MDKKNKTFCVAPWISTYVNPQGKVYPCCVWDQDKLGEGLGNVNNDSLENIYKSNETKRIRQALLSGEILPECAHCDRQSSREFDVSYRSYLNEKFKHVKINSVDSELKLMMWDIRLSNFCNFKCRSCSLAFSSSWFEDHKILHPTDTVNKKALIQINDKQKFLTSLEKHYQYVEEVYFAGGEPLIMPEHYTILEELIKRQKQPKLRYNTNLSNLDVKGVPIESYWEKFDTVDIAISIDGIGPIGEYIRKGFEHQVVVKNIERIQKFVKNQRSLGKDFSINYTVTFGALNYFHMIDFIKFFVNNNFLNEFSNLQSNPLFGPKELNCKVLPQSAASKYRILKDEYIESINDGILQDKVKNFLNDIYNFSVQETPDDSQYRIESFLEHTLKLDNIRNESLKEVFKGDYLLDFININ